MKLLRFFVFLMGCIAIHTTAQADWIPNPTFEPKPISNPIPKLSEKHAILIAYDGPMEVCLGFSFDASAICSLTKGIPVKPEGYHLNNQYDGDQVDLNWDSAALMGFKIWKNGETIRIRVNPWAQDSLHIWASLPRTDQAIPLVWNVVPTSYTNFGFKVDSKYTFEAYIVDRKTGKILYNITESPQSFTFAGETLPIQFLYYTVIGDETGEMSLDLLSQ